MKMVCQWRDYLTWVSNVRWRGTESTIATNNSDDGEGFRGNDGRRIGIQSQVRQTARASEAATEDDEGFRGSDGRRRGLQMQRRQTARA
ncbi:hypothetical protein Scep_011862 [Stephania cephalantha]|uniref:Uncharacterized protein n=1 Tax=Stephania cephalantha TaxID=152367 RepID=A0AAP0JE65_9MAGN